VSESFDPEHQRRVRLGDEPIYVAARRLAPDCGADDLLPIPRHSAEWAVIADMIGSGSRLKRIVVIEPVRLEFDERWEFPGKESNGPILE
jgi:hypothetical protein